MGIRRGSITTGIIADGLVFNMDAANRACYPKTGTTATDTTNDISGTIDGPTFSNTNFGIFNFDSIDDFMNFGSASYLNGLSQFTLSCWFKMDTAAIRKCIVSDWYYNSGVFGHFALQTENPSGTDFDLTLFIKQTSDAGNNVVKTSRIFTENTWHNAIFSYNSGTVVCYKDGLNVSLTTVGTIPSTLTTQEGSLNIGKWGGSLTRYWDGDIANIQLYNRALSSNEALHNYNALKGRFE